MDLAIQMRSIDMMLKLLKHDVGNLPAYGYRLQKLTLPEAKAPMPLARSAPEAVGVASGALKRFFEAVSAEPDTVAAHGALILRRGKVIAEGAWAPYRTDVPHMLYSMSKSFTGTAIGIAADEGFLSLDERLVDIFPDLVSTNQAKLIRGMTVKHLLTMSSGSRFNEMGTLLDGNWQKMFLESMPKFEPGTAFDYNSLNTYMLAAVLCRKTGQSVVEYLKPRLFAPLHIERFTWETCPMGIEKGGWGLSLTMEDAAKLGQLYLNKGMWEGKRIFSEAWAEAATQKQIDTPKGEMKHGYGYQIWISDDEGGFQFNGAFGQYVIVSPKHEAVAVIFGGSANLFAQGTLTEHLRTLFSSFSDAPLPPDDAAESDLKAYCRSLVFSPTVKGALAADGEVFSRMAAFLDGKEYRFRPNAGGILPQTLQSVHGNFTAGTDMLRFARREYGMDLFLYEQEDANRIAINGDGTLRHGRIAIRGEWHRTGARALWKE
ncbi:MAG: serine hydrolase, partial [Clostridiales bacterium]|nr:serine hydrolase [Clostridiales bacterium]